MLSRVADSLFWMSRYLERAEHIARVVDVNLQLTLDRAPADVARHWGRLLASLPEPPPWHPRETEDRERLEVDLANRESIAACVGVARENARQVREEITSEMWEQINRLFLSVQRSRPSDFGWSAGTHEFLAAAIESVHLFQGVTDATMTHGEGWQFITLGRYLERARAIAALLSVQFSEAAVDTEQPTEVGEYVEWVGLLKSSCAFEAYCRHYTADIRPRRIAEFLVFNAEFPRSIHFAAIRIQSSLECIGRLTGRTNNRAERMAGRLLASLSYGQIDEVIGDLPAYLEGIIGQIDEINGAVYQEYIAYLVESAYEAT